jgi:hypothetical protein
MSAEDKARMAKSLAAFGDLSGITLNRRTGLLVGGHQRTDVLAGGTLDVTDLPAPEPDGTVARGWLLHGGKRYAVRVVDWPEETARAALLAANRFGRVGADDMQIVKDLLEALDNGAADMDLTGYSEDAIEELMNQIHQDGGDNPAIYDQSVQMEPAKEFLVILLEPSEIEEARELLALKQVRRGGYKNGSPFDAVGNERCIKWGRVKDAIRNSK